MSKWFEVQVTTIKIFSVEVGDNEDASNAQEYAIDEVGMSGCSDAKAEELLSKREIDSSKRHADEVLGL